MGNDEVWDLVEDAVERFEQASSSTEGVDFAQFLPEGDDIVRRSVLVRLIILDQERRWQEGEQPLVEQYLQQWPELHQAPDALATLIRAERRIRSARGDALTADEIAHRFPEAAAQFDLHSTGHRTSGETDTMPRNAPVRSLQELIEDERAPRRFGSPENPRRYEVRARLGRGGMGEVYQAYDTELQREVAIKVPRDDPSLEPEVAMRFLREIRAAAALRHPNICPVYDAHTSEGHYFIVMALIDGADLEARLREWTPEPHEAVRLLAKVARALETAHQAGVVHRDIKPGNILLDESGEPLLTDFGLCRRVRVEGGKFSQSTLLGTPAYMAPEQAAVQPAGCSSDIYSLGVVMYRMLTGSLPFSGGTAEVLSQVVDRTPLPPRQRCPKLDPALDAICLRAMARKPEDRYQSAGQFAAALEDYAALPAPSVPAPPKVRLLRRASVVVASLLVLAVPAAFIYPRANDRQTDGETAGLVEPGGSVPSDFAPHDDARPLRNVALAANGAKATAISTGRYLHDVRWPSFAIDGDRATGWRSHWCMPAWLQVEFDREYDIEQVAVGWGTLTHTFSIALSPDGIAWTTVISPRVAAQKSHYVGGQSIGGELAYEVFPVAKTPARFLRIDITSTTAPHSHIFQAGVNSLEAYAAAE